MSIREQTTDSHYPGAPASSLKSGSAPRILHSVPYFPPDQIGGVGEVVFHLHRSLLDRGYQSTVVTTGCSESTTDVVRICRNANLFPLKLSTAFGLLRQHDILHVHHGDSLMLLMLSKVIGKPSLCTIHCSCAGIARAHREYTIDGHVFGQDRQSIIRRLVINPVRHALDLVSMRIATRTNFISEYGAREFNFPVDDQHVIYNGIPDAPKLSPTEEEETDMLFVGTASHRKRVNMLPFVLQDVQSKLGRRVTLRIVGFDENKWPAFFDLANDLGVADCIICEGQLTSRELQRFYRQSKVLLVPSAYEGLPMVIGEAQRAGLVCVATDVCAHGEAITQNENGLLVSLDSVEEFSAAACRLLKDDALRAAMSKKAILSAERLFSLERQADSYCRLYRTLALPGFSASHA